MEEQKGYEEFGIEPLLQGGAQARSHYTKNIPVQKWHTHPVPLKMNRVGPLTDIKATSNLVLDTALLPSK